MCLNNVAFCSQHACLHNPCSILSLSHSILLLRLHLPETSSGVPFRSEKAHLNHWRSCVFLAYQTYADFLVVQQWCLHITAKVQQRNPPADLALSTFSRRCDVYLHWIGRFGLFLVVYQRATRISASTKGWFFINLWPPAVCWISFYSTLSLCGCASYIEPFFFKTKRKQLAARLNSYYSHIYRNQCVTGISKRDVGNKFVISV